MEALKVGIREFREKMASYLLESDVPVAITRPGDTVGYYIPARHKRVETERAALKEAASRLQQVLAAEGISETRFLRTSSADTRRRDASDWPGSSGHLATSVRRGEKATKA